jgi:glycine cleavage system H protein
MTQSDDKPGGEALRYQRCRFSTLIPWDRVYTPDHYWLQAHSPGVWRVGFSPWAVRLLGDLVECRFDVAEGAAVELHQAVGALEGFKAAVEIRSAVSGVFACANPVLALNLDVIADECYGAGWLYMMAGAPDTQTCDAAAYRLLLDRSVDAMRGSSPAP